MQTDLTSLKEFIRSSFESPGLINGRISPHWIRGSPTFTERIIDLEQKFNLELPKWPRSLTEQLQICRINQILTIAKQTRMFSSSIGNIVAIEELGQLSFLGRNQYSEYMNPESGLGFPLGYDEADHWILGQSGGTTSGPIYTRTAKRDKFSTAFQTARSVKFWLDTLGGAEAMWNFIPYRQTYAPAFKKAGFRFFEGKAGNRDEMVLKIQNYRPQVIMGSAFAIRKQTQLLHEVSCARKDLLPVISDIRFALFGGEFMTQQCQQEIHNLLPSIQLISRYISSQTGYGIIAYGMPHLPRRVHILDEGICRVIIVDENRRPVPDGQWGEVAVVNLHMVHQPVPGALIGDEARIILSEPEEPRQLELRGRIDDIVVINTQKIHSLPIIDNAVQQLKKMFPKINFNGIGQIAKQRDGNFLFRIENCSLAKQRLLSEIQTAILQKTIEESIQNIALQMGLSPSRCVENLHFKFQLLPEDSIERKGSREKIRTSIDESV